jgi:hypothetical protein
MKCSPVLLVLALAAGGPAARAQTVFDALLPVEERPLERGPRDLRTRAVRLTPELELALRERALGPGDAIALEAFADARLELRVERAHAGALGGWVLAGGIDGDPLGCFALADQDGAVAATVRDGRGRVFSLRRIEGRVHRISELDPLAFGSCSAERAMRPEIGPRGSHGQPLLTPKAATLDDLDLLVVFTPAARAAAGSAAALVAAVEVAVAEANVALEASLVPSRYDLVGVAEVSYGEGGATLLEHLQRLTGSIDGSMDVVHTYRELVGADMVSLIVADDDGGGACGIAWLLDNPPQLFADNAFSVCNLDCTIGNLTLPHELGHNLGCEHEPGSAGPGGGYYSYSFGHRFFGVSGQEWRTVLAYEPGIRIPRFSSPLVDWDGVPTGTATRDNGLTQFANAPYAEAWDLPGSKLATVYVDFSTLSPIQTGSSFFPYDSLWKGLLRVSPGGTLRLSGGTSGEHVYVGQDVRLEALSGPVQIGP